MSATLDMENDKLTVDLKKRNELIKMYASRVTKLETELVQAKALVESSIETEEEGMQPKKSRGSYFGSFFKKSKPSKQ